MKEGAIIHRLRCYRALRGITLPPSFEMTVGFLDSRRLKSQGSALRRSGYPHEGR